VRELVEDELLLAVPFAPRHERCVGASGMDEEGKASPFAELRGLLQSRH